ncbi:MAG TPA: Flp pilus assembly protein CpaB [Dehalococcoidia bacterium]|nr:Flp pilus assembly protein CpaB [Dehalococcoidia bacterium]
MSRNAAALNPARGNRRFILLALVLGLLGAGLVYVATSRNATTTRSGGADTPVVVAKVDIPARTTITASMVEVRFVPADARSVQAYAKTEELVGKVTRFPIAVNEQVLSSKIVDLSPTSSASTRSLSYVIPPGKRAFSITASEVQDVGGLLLPGDYVDVYVIYDVEFRDKTADAYLVQVLLQNKEVLAVSQTIVDIVPSATPSASGQRVRNSEAAPKPDAQTVTLALTPEEAQMLYLAEGNGKIRLALRPYGESQEVPINFATENDLFPPNLPNPFVR